MLLFTRHDLVELITTYGVDERFESAVPIVNLCGKQVVRPRAKAGTRRAQLARSCLGVTNAVHVVGDGLDAVTKSRVAKELVSPNAGLIEVLHRRAR